MYVSFTDLHKKSNEIILALSRNKRITLLHRGKPLAIMLRIDVGEKTSASAKDHAAFGIWKDRDETPTHMRSDRL